MRWKTAASYGRKYSNVVSGMSNSFNHVCSVAEIAQLNFFLGSIECIPFTSFFSPAGFTTSHGYRSRMPGHFRLWPPSPTG